METVRDSGGTEAGERQKPRKGGKSRRSRWSRSPSSQEDPEKTQVNAADEEQYTPTQPVAASTQPVGDADPETEAAPTKLFTMSRDPKRSMKPVRRKWPSDTEEDDSDGAERIVYSLDEPRGSRVRGTAGITGGSQGEESSARPVGLPYGIVGGCGFLLEHTRFPWLIDCNMWFAEHRHLTRRGNQFGTVLFDCSELIDIPTLPDDRKEFYLIDLFFQKRFFRKDSHFNPMIQSGPNALADGWEQFVIHFKKDPVKWKEHLDKDRARYCRNVKPEGPMIEIHTMCIEEGIPCCITREQQCILCYPDSMKATELNRTGRGTSMSDDLHDMIRDFDIWWESHKREVQEDIEYERRQARNFYEDPSYLTQRGPDWMHQHIRNLESEVFYTRDSNTALRFELKKLKADNIKLWNKLNESKDQLAEVYDILDDKGLLGKRQRQ